MKKSFNDQQITILTAVKTENKSSQAKVGDLEQKVLAVEQKVSAVDQKVLTVEVKIDKMTALLEMLVAAK